jgi:hypothetical protein
MAGLAQRQGGAMKARHGGSALAALLCVVPLLLLPAGCAVDGGYGYGYDSSVSVGVGMDYYEPLGFDYGGWGRGYNVGPPRGGERRGEGDRRGAVERHGGGAPGQGYRPAGQGRAVPSIPSGQRSGAGRGAGGRKK